MDFFQYVLSYHGENTSTFSDIFRTVYEFHQLLKEKSYLLDHYLSMIFHLITEIDFCALEDELCQTISKTQKKILNNSKNIPYSIPVFECQELSTQQKLFWTALADTLLEQALTDFLTQSASTYQGSVDLVDLEQTEQKLLKLLGKDAWTAFQKSLTQCFFPCSLVQLFQQGIIIEITKNFLLRDLETDQEIFRLFLNRFFIEKSS